MATKKTPPPPAKPPAADPTGGFELVNENITNALDPHLQDVLLVGRANQEQSKAVVRETAAGETIVDVIARLKDPSQAVPGLRAVRTIGSIVTGSVSMNDIEAVRAHPNVASLKRATELHQDLNFSVPEIGADGDSLRALVGTGQTVPTGKGVIVGIVDYDLDFVHRNFRNADGTSRILLLWDQQSPKNSMSPVGFEYGREFTQADINSAFNTADPYVKLSYKPDRDAHGTHVTDIAAGNGRATGNPGVAPEADIIFVHLHGGDFGDDESFGNSKTLLEAADYIFGKARALGRPCVINMSLGTHGGPHDGTTLAEQGFDHLLSENGRGLVISAGNSFESASHASGRLNPGQTRQLTWHIDNADTTDNELEVWYPGDCTLSVSLISPAGARLGPVQPGNTVTIARQGTSMGSIISRLHDPNNNDNQINIIMRTGMGVGDWKVELSNTGAAPAVFDAWIERDDRGQSRFADADDDPARTIGSISCGQKTLVVGSYRSTVPLRDISSFSSSGPTRDGRQKPEVSAPGDQIRAARSLTQSTLRMSGTSMAAPHVAGLVALGMHAAGRPLSCDEVRALVMTHSRLDPPAAGQWDARYGVGRIGAVAALRSLMPGAPANPIEAEVNVNGAAKGSFAGLDGFVQQLVAAAGQAQSKVSIHIEIDPVRR